ncbi:sensor histidine kinase [Streptomyces sp. NPDC052040]|uniref:sensor histidine kinase n=1 Tax=unclassified Streptomyces TaxID=2593676 RepID=UPI0037D0582F
MADAYTTRSLADYGLFAGRYGVEATSALGLGALMLYRRRFPMAVTWVAVLADMTVFAPFALALALFTMAAKRRSRRWMWSTVAAATLVHTYVISTSGADGLTRLASQWLGFVAGPVTAGILIRTRREMAARSAEQARQRARVQERARIAREMHDVVTHQVTHMVMRAGALELTADRGADWVAEEAAAIAETGRRAVDELHYVLGVLTPHATASAAVAEQPPAACARAPDAVCPPPDPLPIAPDVPSDPAAGTRHREPSSRTATALVEPPRLSARTSLDALEELVHSYEPVGTFARIDVVGRPRQPVPERAQRAVYRLVQEALTNAAKHAPGAVVDIRLVHQVDALTVQVTNGPPTLTPPHHHIVGSGRGLSGMRDRMESLGGSFSAGPTPLRTFEIHTRIPLPAHPKEPTG